MRVLLVVTHLLGSGHLARALTLGRAFGAAGHDATIVSGGLPVPHLSGAGVALEQLPALRSDGTNFTRLMTSDGALADQTVYEKRRAHLDAILTRVVPDILITELFPFGRRILGMEFRHLLESATRMARRPVVFSSIRDILAPPSKPKKADMADALLAEYYDGVLVHSDPRATPLEISWPVSPQLSAHLHYTGFVAPPTPEQHPTCEGTDEVLVSAGGGGVGDELFGHAIAAAARDRQHTWRLLVGGSASGSRIAALRAASDTRNTVIEAARPDFRQMLCHAAASLSMCGYNTALDLLQTGLPAVLVPFDDGQEVEQSLRAEALSRLPGFRVLRQIDLTPSAIATALGQVMGDPPRPRDAFDFDGAAQSVKIACDIARRRP